MTIHKMLSAATLTLAALGCSGHALAHGPALAKHGGTVQATSDLVFELVGTPDGAVIYIDDHGRPMAPMGMSGKLTVLNGDAKSEAPLVAVGEKLEAKGVKLASGAKVVAALTTLNQRVITVRFTVK